MSTKRQIDQTPTNQNTKPIFSVKEWCRAAGISECLYFKERREGRGPHAGNFGRRTSITESAAGGAMMGALQTVDFHGDDIETFEHDGRPWVAMRRICENIGQGQAEKLRNQSEKFSCKDIVTAGLDGKKYEMLCIPDGKLALWLASINPTKIPDERTRERLELYQSECAIVLHDYWSGNRSDDVEDPESRALIKALRDQDRLRREQNRIEARQAAFEDGVSYFTVLGYANYIKAHIDLPARNRSKNARKACRRSTASKTNCIGPKRGSRLSRLVFEASSCSALAKRRRRLHTFLRSRRMTAENAAVGERCSDAAAILIEGLHGHWPRLSALHRAGRRNRAKSAQFAFACASQVGFSC